MLCEVVSLFSVASTYKKNSVSYKAVELQRAVLLTRVREKLCASRSVCVRMSRGTCAAVSGRALFIAALRTAEFSLWRRAGCRS